MITPPYLKHGDKIGIAATARFVEEKEIQAALNYLSEKGFNPILAPNIYKHFNQFAGDDNDRAKALQTLLDDENIKAIFCVRGGYGTVRLLQRINLIRFQQHPKWVVGFSDITVLHSLLHNSGYESIHAPLLFNFSQSTFNKSCFEQTINILMGYSEEYKFQAHPLNRQGISKGILIGGNLSVLYSLRGTPYDIDTKDKILFLEDIDEYLYHIDRMMMNLKLGNKLNNIRGLIVGQMTDMKDNKVPFGKSVYEIIAEIISEYNIPQAFGFPAGHDTTNFPLIFGREVVLEVENQCCLRFRCS